MAYGKKKKGMGYRKGGIVGTPEYSQESYGEGGIKKHAKMAALEKLGDMASEGKMKATVIAEDKEGLEKGLEKAKEVLESSEEMEHDYDDMSREELLKLIKSKM